MLKTFAFRKKEKMRSAFLFLFSFPALRSFLAKDLCRDGFNFCALSALTPCHALWRPRQAISIHGTRVRFLVPRPAYMRTCSYKISAPQPTSKPSEKRKVLRRCQSIFLQRMTRYHAQTPKAVGPKEKAAQSAGEEGQATKATPEQVASSFS